MQTITLDKEFKGLLPPLSEETFELLEENILQNGCRDSLVLWGDILIDGYNRYAICTKHDLPFNTINKEFDSREEVTVWIIINQVSRRNLTPMELSNYRGLHYRTEKKIITNAHGKNQYNREKVVEGQKDPQPKRPSTAGELSSYYNISEKTIKRDSKRSEAVEAIGEISPEAKRLILSGKVKIEKKVLEELLPASTESLEALAMAIENGTYEKQKPETAPSPGESQANEGPAGSGFAPGIDFDPGSGVAPGTAGPSQGSGSAPGSGFDPDSGVAPGTPPPPPQAGPPPPGTAIGKLADDFYEQVEAHAKNGAAAEAKKALRSCIDKLEKLYEQI